MGLFLIVFHEERGLPQVECAAFPPGKAVCGMFRQERSVTAGNDCIEAASVIGGSIFFDQKRLPQAVLSAAFIFGICQAHDLRRREQAGKVAGGFDPGPDAEDLLPGFCLSIQ